MGKLCLLLPLLFLFGTDGHVEKTHMSDMCQPQISKTDLFDLAMSGAFKSLIFQIETHNNKQPVSSDRVKGITALFSKYILQGRSIKFALRMLNLQCHFNKPEKDSGTENPEEDAFLCMWEKEAEKCYKYKDKKEGDLDVDINGKPESEAGKAADGAKEEPKSTSPGPEDQKKDKPKEEETKSRSATKKDNKKRH